MKKKMKSFKYLGRNFVPIGKLPIGFDFCLVTRKCRSIEISNYNGGAYSHTEFYIKAKKMGSGEIDVFEMDGEVIVLHCESELFEYSGGFEDVDEVSQGR